MKTLYNSTALDCALELLYRTRGVKIDRDFVTITLEYVSPTQSRLVLTAKAQADDGRKGIYTGTQTFLFNKKNLGAILPTFLVYGSVYPTRFDQLKQYLKATYDILLDEEEFSLVGAIGDVPLKGQDMLGVQLDHDNKFYLKTTQKSGRFPPNQQMAIMVAQPVDDAYPQLQAWGNAPNAILGQDYDFQYTVQGGKPEYRWEVISGTPPRPLSSTGRFLGPVLNPGALSWVVRVYDDRGFFVDIPDSAQVDVAALEVVGEVSDSVVSAELDVQLTASGGQGPYTFHEVAGFTADIKLESDGRLHGFLDGGTYQLDVKVRDVMGRETTRRLEFTVAARTNVQIAQSLLDKMLSWYTFDEGTFDNSEIVLDLHAAANMAFFGDAQGIVGRRGIALNLNGAYVRGVAAAHDIDKAFAIAMVVRDLPGDSSRYILNKWAPASGWALATTADGSGRVELSYHAGGSNRSFVSTGEAFDGSWRHLIANRLDGTAKNQVQFFIDNAKRGEFDTVRDPVTQNTTYPSMLGLRSDGLAGSNYTGDIDECGIFADRLWSDERAYLFNNGSLKSYWQILEDAGLLAPHAAPTLTGTAPVGAVGQNYEFEYVITGGRAPFKNARVVGGELPSGLSIQIVGGNKVRVSGVLTTSGPYPFTLAVNDADDRPAVILSQITVGESTNNVAKWSVGDKQVGVMLDVTETIATTTLNGGSGQRGMVRSTHHAAVPAYFELDFETGQTGPVDAVFGGVVDGRWNVGQPMSALDRGVQVAMPSRNVYFNGALLGKLGGTGTRVGFAVHPTTRRVWLRSPDVPGWFLGGNPETNTLPTATLAGSCPILAAAEPFTPADGSVTLRAHPIEVATPPAGFERGLLEHSTVVSLLHLDEALDGRTFSDEYAPQWTTFGDAQIKSNGLHFDGRGLSVNGVTDYIVSDGAIDLSSGPFAIELFLTAPISVPGGYALPIMQYGTEAEGGNGFAVSLFQNHDGRRQLMLRNSYSNIVGLEFGPTENIRNHLLIVRGNDGYLYACLNGNQWVTAPLKMANGGTDPRTFVASILRLGVQNGQWLSSAAFMLSEVRVVKGTTVHAPGKVFTPPSTRFS